MDHNLDLTKHDIHPMTNDFIDLNLENGLLPTITKPTRITRSTATLIDNIMVGRKFQTKYDSSILISDLSDHFPCLLNMTYSNLFTKKTSTITTRGLNPSKVEEIKQRLHEVDWTQELINKPMRHLMFFTTNSLVSWIPLHPTMKSEYQQRNLEEIHGLV